MKRNYDSIYKIIDSLISSESNLIANLANVTAVLNEELLPLWVGFYIVDVEANELVLGPFQGPLACTRIPYNKGVCGSAWKNKRVELVADVHKFPGHIACSSKTNSEIVIPILKNSEVVAVLDIDSVEFDHFSSIDSKELSRICDNLADLF